MKFYFFSQVKVRISPLIKSSYSVNWIDFPSNHFIIFVDISISNSHQYLISSTCSSSHVTSIRFYFQYSFYYSILVCLVREMETPGLCSKLYLTLLSYVLCVLSNLVIGIGLLFLLVLKGSSKFWKVKARKPPECLQNELYGEHKYLQVNVSFDFYFFNWNRSIFCRIWNYIMWKMEMRENHWFCSFMDSLISGEIWSGLKNSIFTKLYFRYSWRYQIVEFSKDYWTVALDLPGYGNSGNLKRTSDYQIDNLVEIVAEFIRKLGNFFIGIFFLYSKNPFHQELKM